MMGCITALTSWAGMAILAAFFLTLRCVRRIFRWASCIVILLIGLWAFSQWMHELPVLSGQIAQEAWQHVTQPVTELPQTLGNGLRTVLGQPGIPPPPPAATTQPTTYLTLNLKLCILAFLAFGCRIIVEVIWEKGQTIWRYLTYPRH